MSTVVEKDINTEEQSKAKAEEAKTLLKELIEAGVHLGHPTQEWNPRMSEYIFDTRDGVHIINLSRTVNNLMVAADYLKKQSKSGRNILYVGTSKQCSSVVQSEAEKADIFYINQRWLGGLITNFDTIRSRLNKLRELEGMKETGGFDKLGKKEVAKLNRQINKLNKSLGGLKKMRGRPDLVVVFDQNKDHIAITEARKAGLPVVSIVDTDSDPRNIDYLIPANNDSMKSIEVIIKYLTEAVLAGQANSHKRK